MRRVRGGVRVARVPADAFALADFLVGRSPELLDTFGREGRLRGQALHQLVRIRRERVHARPLSRLTPDRLEPFIGRARAQ